MADCFLATLQESLQPCPTHELHALSTKSQDVKQAATGRSSSLLKCCCLKDNITSQEPPPAQPSGSEEYAMPNHAELCRYVKIGNYYP